METILESGQNYSCKSNFRQAGIEDIIVVRWILPILMDEHAEPEWLSKQPDL